MRSKTDRLVPRSRAGSAAAVCAIENAHGERGFTLLEVITALFIFLCGVVGIISLFTTALVLHKTSHDRTVTAFALEQAVSKVARMLDDGGLRDPSTGLLKALDKVPLDGHPGFFFSATFQESAEEGTDTILASIDISWRARGREMKETFAFCFRPGVGLRNEVMRLRGG